MYKINRQKGKSFLFIKNLSFLHLTKKLPFYVLTSLCNSVFKKFKKSLLNTFIYKSILIKIYVNADIMNAQIFYIIKYELNGH